MIPIAHLVTPLIVLTLAIHRIPTALPVILIAQTPVTLTAQTPVILTVLILVTLIVLILAALNPNPKRSNPNAFPLPRILLLPKRPKLKNQLLLSSLN